MKNEFYCFGCLQHKHIDLLGTRKNCKLCDQKAIKKSLEKSQKLIFRKNKIATKDYKNEERINKMANYLNK